MTRVLIVDDEKDLADYFAYELEAEGYETGTANDGVEAVLKAIDGHWNALIMDIRMPRLDGINALKIIRQIDPGVAVVMITGQAGQTEMLEATCLGAYTCLLKPVSTVTLFNSLKQALQEI